MDGTLAYDPTGNQLFLFGGQDASGSRNDLWSYSLTEKQWQTVTAAGSAPAPRFGHTLVFDSTRRRLILFGGQSGGFFSDVWSFDIAEGRWTQLSADDAGPTRRYGHSGIYDAARNRLVISHGFTNAGRFDDTWAFDLGANAWRNITPAGVRPLKRCLHHAVYDPAGGRMFLYGGCSSGFGPCPQGDLWSFDLASATWTEQVSSAAPPAREHYGMSWDAQRGKLLVYGGNGNGLLGDTWEFAPSAGAWQQSSLQGPSASARQRQESAYAGSSGATFFFGGSTNSGLTNELWMLAPAVDAPPALFTGGLVNAFSGVGGEIAPGEIIAMYGAFPGATGALGSFDAVTGLLPTTLGSTSVTVGGIPAPLYFVGPGQVNAQIPYEITPGGMAAVVVATAAQKSQPVNIAVVPARPGLFPGVFNQDFSLNSAANPAVSGSIVIFYATGQGATLPASRTGAFFPGIGPDPAAPVSLDIGGSAAGILYRGQAPGTAGVMQINARLPAGITGTLPVVLKVGEASGSAVNVVIR